MNFPKDEIKDMLNNVLSDIEKKIGKLYTLQLCDMVSDYPLIKVGDLKERQCKWKVKIFPKRKQEHDGPPTIVDTELDFFWLEDVYDSYHAIEIAITDFRLEHLVKIGVLNSYERLDEGHYKIVCEHCTRARNEHYTCLETCVNRDCKKALKDCYRHSYGLTSVRLDKNRIVVGIGSEIGKIMMLKEDGEEMDETDIGEEDYNVRRERRRDGKW